MSWQAEIEPCPLVCPWNGTEMCVRHLLSIEGIAEHHLSLAVACGLRHVYHPHGLPPCVTPNGDIDCRPILDPVEEPAWQPDETTEGAVVLV